MDRYIKLILIALVVIIAFVVVSCEKKSTDLSSVIMIDENGLAISLNGKELYKFEEVRENYKVGSVIGVVEVKEGAVIVGGDIEKSLTRNLVDINIIPDIMSENSDILLVDVRTPGEFNGGHLENSINYPVENIGSGSDLNWEKDKTIIVYCRSGSRSATAAKLLNELGYNFVLDGGGVNSYKGSLVK